MTESIQPLLLASIPAKGKGRLSIQSDRQVDGELVSFSQTLKDATANLPGGLKPIKGQVGKHDPLEVDTAQLSDAALTQDDRLQAGEDSVPDVTRVLPGADSVLLGHATTPLEARELSPDELPRSGAQSLGRDIKASVRPKIDADTERNNEVSVRPERPGVNSDSKTPAAVAPILQKSALNETIRAAAKSPMSPTQVNKSGVLSNIKMDGQPTGAEARSLAHGQFITHLNESLGLAKSLRIHADVTAAPLSAFQESAATSGMTTIAANAPTAHAPTASAAVPASYSVPVSFEEPAWKVAFANQVAGMIRKGQAGEHIAQLRLDPPELGPIRVQITLADGVAHAVFGSAHAQVRQTIEQAMPDLARALSQAGIDLGQTGVRDDSGAAPDERSTFTQFSATTPNVAHSTQPEQADPARVSASHNGVVNTFA